MIPLRGAVWLMWFVGVMLSIVAVVALGISEMM